MDRKFRIFNFGVTGQMVKPVTVALAVCCGIKAPSTQLEFPGPSDGRSDLFSTPSQTTRFAPSSATFLLTPVSSDQTVERPNAADILPVPKQAAALLPGARDGLAAFPNSTVLPPKSEFASSFADFDEWDGNLNLADQMIDPAPVGELAAGEAEITTGLPSPQSGMNIAARHISELTAFAPAPDARLNLADPEPEKPALNESGSSPIAFIADPVVQPVAPQTNEPADLTALGAARVVNVEPAQARPQVFASKLPARPKNRPAAWARLPDFEEADLSTGKRLEAKPVGALKPISKVAKGPATAKAGYLFNANVIDFALPARLNGESVGSIPLQVTRDDRLWLRIGDLLTLVRGKMDSTHFELLAASAAANEYIEFEAVRRAGISLQYDAAHNRIDLGSR